MRKLKLLIGGVATLLLGGVNSVYAYTVEDLTSAGWTQITSISQSDITDKYYVFVANDADLVLGLATSSNQGNTAAFYQTLANPALDAKKVWTLEVNGSNYAMRNLYSNSRQMQTESSASSSDLRWRTNDQTASVDWTGLGMAYAEGAWTLTSTQYNRPLGIYNNGTGTPTEGQEIGANDADKGQKFQIYAINRNAYWTLAAGLATIDNPVLSFTGLISNQEIYNKTNTSLPRGWSEDTSYRKTGNDNRTAGTGVTVLEAWSGGESLKVHYYQNISEVPSGIYRLTAKAQDESGNGGGNIYISDGTTEQKVSFGKEKADVTTPNYIFDGGTLTIGLRANGTASWVNATDFRLACLGKLIRQAAIEIPDGGSVIAANQWYKYVVKVSGYYTITAESAEGFIQTVDGEQMAENGTGAAIATGTDVALTVGSTIYYKSTSANTLTIVLKTKGAISDGTYYFQKSGAQKYLSRGGNWGTEAVVADLGISFELSVQPDGTYTFKNHDLSRAIKSENKYLFYNNGSVYTDQAEYRFTLEATDGGYYLRPNATHYLTSNNYSTGIDVAYDYITHTENANDAIVWVPISKETYQANVATVRDAEAAAVAAAAGVAASTLSALKSAVASDFISSDLTSSIKNAACVENLDNWASVKYAANGHKDFDANGTCGEVFDGHGGIKQSIEGLEKGLYKVSVHATWRPGTKESGNNAGSEINTNAWVYANTATSANLTQLKSWHEGGATIDSRADMKASGDTYLNDVYVYVAEGETLTIGLASPTKCNGAWLPFFGWTLTRYDAKATEAERQALADAIAAAEAKTLGFEDGEYAPYNNLEAFAQLDAAKAIDKETALGTEVVAATTALNGAWNANFGEVNAFYGGDFTQYETKDKKDYPYGWNLYNGADNHSRIMGGSEGTNNTGLSASSSGKALLLKYNATYGEREGYTMPLKAGKIYKITFKHGRWNEANPRLTDVVMTDPSGASITLAPAFQAKNNSCESNAANWETYTGYFVSTTAGNYKFNLTKQNDNNGNNSQMQIGIADIDLRTASELEFADGTVPTYAPGTYPTVKITRSLAAGRWATAVYPFAVSGVDDIAVLDSYNASTGVLGFKSATASTANVPFLMRSTAGATAITVSNVAVAAAAATDAKASEASLKGTYTQMTVGAGEGVYNYVLSNNTIYKVGQNEATINPYRAYIQLTQPVSSARALSFFIDSDTTTGIDGLTAEDAKSGQVFSLSGQRVKSPRKGLYIMNGRKVFVK